MMKVTCRGCAAFEFFHFGAQTSNCRLGYRQCGGMPLEQCSKPNSRRALIGLLACQNTAPVKLPTRIIDSDLMANNARLGDSLNLIMRAVQSAIQSIVEGNTVVAKHTLAIARSKVIEDVAPVTVNKQLRAETTVQVRVRTWQLS